MSIPVEELKTLVGYDPETGAMWWLPRQDDCSARKGEARRWNARFAGKPIGTVSTYGYLVACIHDKQVKMHRVAYALHHGEWPIGQIDHINRDRADNRICNLRDVSTRENALNRNKSSRNKSGVVGVCRSNYGTFIAYISAPGRRKHLGTFKCFGRAVMARKAAEVQERYWGA